jgi:hypothetical protein
MVRSYSILFFLIVGAPLLGVTIGSDTAPSRIYTLQTLNTGDRVASFPFLFGGLTLSSLTVTATWDCVFPLGSQLAMNSGTLLLNTDLFLADNSSIASMGGFIGQNHVFGLSSTNTYIHASTTAGAPSTISNLTIELGTDTILQNCHLLFTGTNMINGYGSALTLLPTATLILGTNATLQFRNITLNGMSINTLYASTTTSTFIFNNTTINLSNNYTFSTGRFEIYNDVLITGNGFGVNYSSTGASFIASHGQLMLDQGVTFSYVPSNAATNLFTFADRTAQLYLRGGIFYTGAGGIQFLKGNILIGKQSYFFNAGTGSATGIILGDGATASNDPNLDILPAAVLNVPQGYLVYNNV